MAEELRLHVVSTANSKGLRDAAKDIKGLRGETDKLGDSFDDTEHEAFDLNDALVASRKRSDELRRSFAQLGDTVILKDLRKERGFGAELERIRREIAGGDGGFAKGILSSLGGMSFRSKAIAALVGLAVYASPAIGAIIGGAVVGATLTGGIAGGIAAASKDSRVRAAARDFGADIAGEFFGSGESFVQPTINSLGILSDAFKDLDLESLFAKAAPGVEILARGVADFAENLMPGLNRVMDESVPIATELANGLAYVGEGVSDMLIEIMGSEGTLEGLRTMFLLIGDTARFLGKTIGALGNTFHFLAERGAELSGGLEDAMLTIGVAGIPASMIWRKVNDDLERVGVSAGGTVAIFKEIPAATVLMNQGLDPFAAFLAEARKEARGLNVELREMFGAEMSAAEALDEFDAKLDDLTETLKENGNTIDRNTEKGRENRTAWREQIKAAQDVRDTQIRQGMAVSAANKLYMDYIAVIEEVARKSKITKAQLEEMAGRYEISIFTTYTSKGTPPGGSLGRSVKFSEFQHGGQTPAFEPFWAGEGGVPELVFPTGKPQYVMNGPDSAAFAARMARGAGRGNATVRHVIDLRLNGRTIREIAIDDAVGRGIPQATVAAAYP